MTDATCDMCLYDVSDDEARYLKSIGGVRVCRDCREWLDYWESILAERRARELRSMDRHAASERGQR